MIVRDEGAIIERCLDAIAPQLDWWVVVDTGSRDDTRERVRAAFARAGVGGELHELPFVDFSTTRNAALDLARASDGVFDYLLLADADMLLEVADPAFRERLSAPAYRVRQHNAISYWNTRLLRRDVPARYVGATHEYLAVEGDVARLDAIAFADRADGANRAGKFERDIALLAPAVERDPADTRSLFYLAQSYRDAGRLVEARDTYARRAEAGGWDEEAWYALWQHARCCLALGDAVGFVDGCLSAYEARPARAEPIAELARFYRERGQNETAMLWVEAGRRIPYPAGDLLFVDEAVYRHAFIHETSIAGWYSKLPERREAARVAALDLQIARDAPAALRHAARRNAVHYAGTADALLGPLSRADIALATEAPFVPMNPSVALDGDELVAMVRTVDYRIEEFGPHWLPGRVIRTRNHLARLGRDGRVTDAREAIPAPELPPALPLAIRGFEDCRLFRWRGAWRCTATARDRNEATRCEVFLLTLDQRARVVGALRLHGVGDALHQKNWMPAIDGDDLALVYLCDPTTVLALDGDDGRVRVRARHEPSVALDHLRGGSQAIAFDGGWLAATHEVVVTDGGRRHYLHRLVRFDRDWRVAAITEAFRFGEGAIEFVAGLAHDPRRDELIVSYGVDDRCARIATFAADGARSALIALP